MRRVALAIRSPTVMWNNRAMSNRYWISVAAVAAAAALAGVYVARMLSMPAVPSLESGTSFPRPRPLRRIHPRRYARCARSWRRLRGHPTLVFFGFTHCPDVCPTTLALLASVQKQVARCPGLKVALISVDPERDTPGATRQVHRVIRRRSYRPHRARARDCEDHEELWRGGEPRRSRRAAATPWTIRPRYSRSIRARASSRCSRRRSTPPR